MKIRHWIWVFLLAVAWLAIDSTPQRSAPSIAAKVLPAGSARSQGSAWPPAIKASVGNEDLPRVALEAVDQAAPAAQSLSESRVNGESRMPPIIRAEQEAPEPDASELADGTAYAAFENRQMLRLMSAFNRAAEARLPALRADIARARQEGVDPADIASIEEKVRMLENTRQQLMQTHPELGAGP